MLQVRIIPQLLQKTLPKPIFNKLTKENIREIEIYTLRHLLKMTGAVEYNKQLKAYMPSHLIKGFKRKVLHNFESIVCFKIACINILQDKQTVEEATKAFSLQGNYTFLINQILEDHPDIAVKCKTIDCKYKSIDCVIEHGKDFLREIIKYGTYFTYKKIQFVARSNRLDYKDLAADLHERAIAVFYNLIPFIDGEHLIRSIKRTMHNEGINMIKYYNASKRRRLNAVDGSYSNTIASSEIVDDSESSTEGDENNYIYKNRNETNCTDDTVEIERRLTIQNLIASQGKQPRKKQVLDLIMMKNNPQFPLFVKEKGIRVRKDWTPEDIFHHIGQKNYLEMVREFVAVEEKGFYSFIEGMKRELQF